MKETLILNIPPIPHHDLYDFSTEKSEAMIKRYGERHIVSKEEYLKAKYPGLRRNPVWSIRVGNEKIGSSGMDFKLAVYDEEPQYSPYINLNMTKCGTVLNGLERKMWTLPPRPTWTQNEWTLPPIRDGQMKLNDFELPLFYEIGLSLRPKEFNGDIELVITAVDYLGENEIDKKIHGQMRFKMHSNGERLVFFPAYYRPQSAREDELEVFCKPRVTYIELEDKFYDIRVVVDRGTIRLFIAGYAIWMGYCPFYSGHFELRYDNQGTTPLKVNNFFVLELGPQHRTDLKDSYVLPQPLKEIADYVVNHEWLKNMLPNYGKRAYALQTKDWYGISTEEDNVITKDKLEISSGKTFLFQTQHHKKLYKYQFSVILGSPLSSLKLLRFNYKRDGNNVHLELWREILRIRYQEEKSSNEDYGIYAARVVRNLYIKDALKYSPEDKVDITIEFLGESCSIVGRMKDKIVFSDEVWQNGDATLFAFEIDAKKPMLIEFPKQ